MAASNKTSSNKTSPFLNGFLVGLFTGLALAIVVALLITRSNPFINNPAEGLAKTVGKNDPPADAPRYEFGEAMPAQQAAATASAQSVPGNGYFLQVGAFRLASEADQIKAQLTLLGFETKTIFEPGMETQLYKVQTGPYRGLDELNTARARLTQNGIASMLVKNSPPTPPQETP